jgi:hypothetical protein
MFKPDLRLVTAQSMVIALFLFAGERAMSLEQPEYTVLYEDGDIEYRQYEPYLVAETVVQNSDDFREAGNAGFRRLFKYISGANTSQAKIAMTAPVTRTPRNEDIAMTAPVRQVESADGWNVAFMLPKKYSIENAPIPTDDRLRIRMVPGRLMAVLRYSGRWTEKNFLRQRDTLQNAVDGQAVNQIGEFESAAYNPPYMPPFMRRNEVMIEVDRLPASAEETLTHGSARS